VSDERLGALVALAGLPHIGPPLLRRLVAHHDPVDALQRLRSGRPLHRVVVSSVGESELARLRAAAEEASPAAALEACRSAGVRPLAVDADDYPGQLAIDPEAPPVLFALGDLAALGGRRVGVIGTRNATVSGLATATELGQVLAAHGVSIVSGLARGIDGAAHRGVRRAGGPGRPVAVVGNGLDRPYPKQHAELWAWVAEAGVVLSEWPPGVAPHAWRFPQRNRILAALCEVLVVVESRERGGSLITARAAADRSVEVMAVPGSPRSRASAGTNRLLVDGVAPVTSADDVLAMLGLDHRRQGPLPFDPRPRPDDLQAAVLALCVDRPCTLDMLVEALDVPIATAALAAARLERNGWLAEAGGWFEPAGSRLQPP
jgi:DNA processing protein